MTMNTKNAMCSACACPCVYEGEKNRGKERKREC